MQSPHSITALMPFSPIPQADGHAPAHSPRQNGLLAALPADDYERLLPDLQRVELPQGRVIVEAGARVCHLYFPISGLVSRLYVTEDGATTEVAISGNEGVIGVTSFLGGASTLNQAVVLVAGHAYRLSTHVLDRELEHDGPLLRLLLRYTQALIAQAGQIAVCNRLHSLDQQLCRWLLACLDRSPTREVPVTHQLVAQMLGVRREGVTQAAGDLQKAGLIRHTRGHFTVVDRPRLEARACECYAVVAGEYERLFPANRPRLLAS